METVAQLPAHVEPILLTTWDDPASRARTGRAAAISILGHIAAITLLLAMPETFMQPAYRTHESLVTPLIEPPMALTQREPNRGKLHPEFRSTDLHTRPSLPPVPAPNLEPPAPRRASAPPPAAGPVALPEPPKEEANNSSPKLTLPTGVPQIQAEERPGPAFEDVTAPRQVPANQRVLEIPGPSNALGSAGMRGPGGIIPGISNLPQGSSELPQLLSDPQGVDFRPYLAQVLAAIKQYWYKIMPDAVKMGRTGRVSIQFAILRDGAVGRTAWVERTGVSALDNAGLFAISGAAPFPQLPAQYRGSEIHVQVNFAYNVPRQ